MRTLQPCRRQRGSCVEPEVAEACKILENTYRAVNIALVNELKMLYDKLGIDVWEVIDAAKTKPFGFQAFYPGPGLGGHCIPIDPFYLTWVARKHGEQTRFIELAGEINARMPQYVVDRLVEFLNEAAQADQRQPSGDPRGRLQEGRGRPARESVLRTVTVAAPAWGRVHVQRSAYPRASQDAALSLFARHGESRPDSGVPGVRKTACSSRPTIRPTITTSSFSTRSACWIHVTPPSTSRGDARRSEERNVHELQSLSSVIIRGVRATPHAHPRSAALPLRDGGIFKRGQRSDLQD